MHDLLKNMSYQYHRHADNDALPISAKPPLPGFTFAGSYACSTRHFANGKTWQFALSSDNIINGAHDLDSGGRMGAYDFDRATIAGALGSFWPLSQRAIRSVLTGLSAADELKQEPDLSVQTPRVLVVIVNYCTADLTIDCLRSLETEIRQYPAAMVVVADNASPDGSGQLIARSIAENSWSTWARMMPLPRNGGFAYGNNCIIREMLAGPAVPDFVWLLNSDTIVQAGALRALVEFLQRQSTVGIAGSCLENPDGTQQCSGFRFHSIVSEFENGIRLGPVSRILGRWVVARPPERISAPYDWVSGASMMIRSDVFRQVGLLDEAFFLYYEEADLCRRARRYGWSCAFVSDSRVVHLVGQSSGIDDDSGTTRRRPAYWFKSRRHYFEKNHGRFYAAGADAARVLGTLLDRLRAIVTRRPAGLPEGFLSDLVRHSAVWPRSTERGKSR